MPELLTKMPRQRAAGGAFVFLATVAGLTWLSRDFATPVQLYAPLLTLGVLVATALLWSKTAISGRTVILVAVLGHAIALFSQTPFEDDYYRFIWDGWRVLEAGTPYGIPPADFFDQEDSIPPDMYEVLNWINYPTLSTIYGPVLQILFAITTFVGGTDELTLRVAFGLGAIALSALMLRRYEPSRVALFAWNPLVVAETTIHIHPDILLALALFAGLVAGRKHPILAGIFIGLAPGVKLVALAVWPMLLKLRPSGLIAAIATLGLLYGVFAIQGQGVGLGTTGVFAGNWYFNPFAFDALVAFLAPDWARIAALLIAGLAVLWFHASARNFDRVPIAEIFGVILLFAPTVNAWYLLWLLPFALDRRRTWPFVAAAVLPLSYFTGINLESLTLDNFDVHPIAIWTQRLAVAAAIAFDIYSYRNEIAAKRIAERAGVCEPAVSVVIPALNEEKSIGQSVSGIIAALESVRAEVIVADNGSTDRTAEIARQAGARVVSEPERGYGAACLAGIGQMDPQSNIILFMDADMSDDPAEAKLLLNPIIRGEADLIIGSRVLGKIEQGAMTMPQRFGNWLAPSLLRLIWGEKATDLGPFRAIRKDAYDQLRMIDRDFGWTIEMQVRAAKLGLVTQEVPVSYRQRIGISKISGTIRGVLAAGTKILFVIGREAFGDFDYANRRRDASYEQPKLALQHR